MREWRCIVAVAATYFYFLLFAQFAFLEGLMSGGVAEGALKPVMAAMGLGGLLGSVGAPWMVARFGAERVMRIAFVFCAVMALGCKFLIGSGLGAVLALLIGLVLGVQTVTLAGSLPGWVGHRGRGGIVVGVGTGLAYACCNVPVIFQAGWSTQAVMVAVVALLGALLVPGEVRRRDPVARGRRPMRWFWAVTLLLLVLVWLDSAAFFIIQHTEAMKKATWGAAQLWRNAGLHFAGAVVAGVALDRGGLWRVLLTALALLAVASQMVNHEELMRGAGWLYPAGVSLYSVALVVFPGFLSGAATHREALRRAAWVFVLAGWIGSALGVGMGENLHQVPVWFVVATGGMVLAAGAWTMRMPWWKSVAAGLGAGFVLILVGTGTLEPDRVEQSASPAVARGHEVYLSEGCIHCHSRYVRPGTGDVLRWGPTTPIDEVRRGRPVTIGNRRQGPDLARVGLRRSAKWLELHFRQPRLFDARSTMPSYAHLFDDRRGSDLVRFLADVDPGDFAKRHEAIGTWKPAEVPGVDGETNFARSCAVCHGAQGRGDGLPAGEFVRPPVDLVEGPFIHTAVARPGESLRITVARVVKFGVPGTDMPGHELLSDAEALGLADWVLARRKANPSAPAELTKKSK